MVNSGSFQKIVVTGATSVIGHFLLPRLLDAGYEVHAVSRSLAERLNPTDKKLFWHQADISHPKQLPGINARALIHLAPLWLLPPLLPALDSLQIERVIGFGSTSLFTKANSPDASERQLAARFAAVEEMIDHFRGTFEMNWTIFRPTLVYDGVRDKNVMVIARFIQRFGFFPLLGNAEGLRQPVHADDLAEACVMALDRTHTYRRSYNMSGGETLSYRQMVETIFKSLGKPIHFLVIPAQLFHWAIRILRLFPGKRSMTPEMATRMNIDLCFDHTAATQDFGFSPRPFLPCWKDTWKQGG